MSEFVKTRITDVIPDEIHGFKVNVTQGPLKNPETGLVLPGRYAVYATLTPGSERIAQKLRKSGRDAILGVVEIAPEFVDEMQNDEKAREFVAVMALSKAALLARKVEGAL